MKLQSISSLNFGRKLTEKEQKGYTKAVNEALDTLGKDVGIILHHSSAPSDKKNDTGIGSLYSKSSRNLVVPFLLRNGFTSVQLEPEQVRKYGDPSPYSSTNSGFNTLMIDLEKLTEDKYGNILSKNTFNDIVKHNPQKNKGRVDFGYVNGRYYDALHEAYYNFKTSNNPKVQALRREFETFKKENKEELEKIALYDALSKENGNSYYKNWNDFDRHLYEQPKDQREGRIWDIKTRYQDDFEYTYFVQMIGAKLREEGIKELDKKGIKTIGDAPVAFSDVDVWANPNIFLKDYYMGCPAEPAYPSGQAWGFAVMDPATYFNPDGSLAEGGKFLFKKYQKLFEQNKGGVRIDHILGLMDPYVYKNSPDDSDSGRLFSNRQNKDFRHFIKRTPEEFGNIISEIVIPAAQSVGLDKDDIICEDLGSIPDHVRLAFNNLGLRGINIMQYTTNRNVPKGNIVMIGSHDSDTLIGYVSNLYQQGDPFNHSLWNLTEDVMPDNASHDKKQDHFDKIRFDQNNEKIAKNGFLRDKAIQLFSAPTDKVQIFWPDLIGLNERYNTPGTNEGNWSLRMDEDFEDLYNKNLQRNRGINIPEALEGAIKQRGSKFAKENSALVKELNKYKNILKEED